MSLCKKVGGRESNSYITVSEAAVFLAAGPDDVADWTALPTEQKELRLRLAAQLIGNLPLRGHRIYDGQALDFPRSSQRDSPYAIPSAVKEAQAYIAFAVVHRAMVNRPDPSETVGSDVKSVSLGGMLSVTFSDKTLGKSTLLDLLTKSVAFPIYTILKPFLSQVRGRSVPDGETYTLSTTTTTTSDSTTSTTNSSTSTSTTTT